MASRIFIPTTGLSELIERRTPGIGRRVAEVLFDPEKLVVFGNAVRAAKAAGLDLTGVGRDGEVGDKAVLGLARAVRDDRCHVIRPRKLNSIKGFRKRADLIDLDEDRV